LTPPRPANGERKLMRWLIGVTSTIALAWAAWVSVSVVQAKVDGSRLDAIQQDVQHIRDVLDRRPHGR
jgi:hypothetical protein